MGPLLFDLLFYLKFKNPPNPNVSELSMAYGQITYWSVNMNQLGIYYQEMQNKGVRIQATSK